MTGKISSEKPMALVEGIKKSPLRPAAAKDQDGTQTTDRVALSAMVKEFNQTREVTSAQDARRAARVNELKQQVASGNYQPDLQQVAASLLKYLANGE